MPHNKYLINLVCLVCTVSCGNLVFLPRLVACIVRASGQNLVITYHVYHLLRDPEVFSSGLHRSNLLRAFLRHNSCCKSQCVGNLHYPCHEMQQPKQFSAEKRDFPYGQLYSSPRPSTCTQCFHCIVLVHDRSLRKIHHRLKEPLFPFFVLVTRIVV